MKRAEAGEVWRSTHKALHAQGGAHKRRSMATAGVLFFKRGGGAGSRAENIEPKGARGGEVRWGG